MTDPVAYAPPFEASTQIHCRRIVVGDCTTGVVAGLVGCGYRGRLDSFRVKEDPTSNAVLCPRCGSARNAYNGVYSQWVADQGRKLAQQVLREALDESEHG